MSQLVALTEVEKLPGYTIWTPRRLRQLVYERRLTHYKVMGRVFVDTADLDAFVEAGRRERAS